MVSSWHRAKADGRGGGRRARRQRHGRWTLSTGQADKRCLGEASTAVSWTNMMTVDGLDHAIQASVIAFVAG
ncbi:hypothetical protein ACLOJK_006974 [Asimina triloba]